MRSASVVVDDLDVLRTCRRPNEADPVLIVNSNTVLALTIAPKRFESVARRHAEILQSVSLIQGIKLSSANPPQLLR